MLCQKSSLMDTFKWNRNFISLKINQHNVYTIYTEVTEKTQLQKSYVFDASLEWLHKTIVFEAAFLTPVLRNSCFKNAAFLGSVFDALHFFICKHILRQNANCLYVYFTTVTNSLSFQHYELMMKWTRTKSCLHLPMSLAFST